jgi:hypothetical protein
MSSRPPAKQPCRHTGTGPSLPGEGRRPARVEDPCEHGPDELQRLHGGGDVRDDRHDREHTVA